MNFIILKISKNKVEELFKITAYLYLKKLRTESVKFDTKVERLVDIFIGRQIIQKEYANGKMCNISHNYITEGVRVFSDPPS